MSEVNFVNVNHALTQANLPFSYDLKVNESWDKKGMIAVIEIQYHDITFEDLQKVSDALGTTKINVDNDVREGGYCETCRYSYSVTVLTVMDVKIPADITTPEAT
jgi:hypothetical protein